MKKITLLFVVLLAFGTYSCDESQIDSVESSELDKKGQNNNGDKVSPMPFKSIDYEQESCGEPMECAFIAGQTIDAGSVTVTNDEEYLYVKVYSKAGFQDVSENIKMWIGLTPPDRRPPSGHFPYKVTENGDTHIFKIELSTLPEWDECGKQYVIIVHGDVLTEEGNHGSGETAYGGCDGVDGKPWWAYMQYETQCCEEEDACMDAFGFKNEYPVHVSCLDYEINGTQEIVWSNLFNYKLLDNRLWKFPLIANADNCDPMDTQGEMNDPGAILVGYIYITMFSEGEGEERKRYTTISYDIINEEYLLTDTNLYISKIENPEDLNPDNGQYTYDINSLEWDASASSYERVSWPGEYDGWDTYVIPHATLCKK